MKKSVKIFIGILVILSMIVVTIGFTDYWKVRHEFEKPIFAKLDSGSGTYRGLGYSFEIQGNFMPEDEFQGVTSFKYYLMDRLVSSGMRD